MGCSPSGRWRLQAKTPGIVPVSLTRQLPRGRTTSPLELVVGLITLNRKKAWLPKPKQKTALFSKRRDRRNYDKDALTKIISHNLSNCENKAWDSNSVKEALHLSSTVDEIWSRFKVMRMFSICWVVQFTDFFTQSTFSKVVRDACVLQITLNLARMLRI